MDRGWLRGKNVIIIGNFDGIDKYLAFNLITKYNCRVIGICSEEKNLMKFNEKINDYVEKFSYEVFDECIETNWIRLYDNLKATNRKVDILINCNMKMMKHDNFENTNHKNFTKSINSYFYPVVFAVRHLLPLIKESRTPAIINIFGMEGVASLKGLSYYSASRSAVKSFMEVLSSEIEDVYIGMFYLGITKLDKNVTNDYYKNVRKKGLSCDKASNLTIDGISKKRTKVVIGKDAKVINLVNKISPKLGSKLTNIYLKNNLGHRMNNID